MRVSQRDELMARALVAEGLLQIGFPKEKIMERVAEAWPGRLEQARHLFSLVGQLRKLMPTNPLDGETTKEAMKQWQPTDRTL